MKKYKVKFKETLTGYIEVFADNEDDAIYKLKKQEPSHGQLVIETEDFDYTEVKEVQSFPSMDGKIGT